MVNKRGQFYLVAAILILLVITGIVSVKSYAVAKSEPRKIQDLGSELKEESPQILDHGIHEVKNLKVLLEDFTEDKYAKYFLKKTENTSIVFIYGNKSNLYSSQYLEANTGTISATLGGMSSTWAQTETYSNRTNIDVSSVIDDTLTVEIFNKEFDFILRDNEMFYFLITQEKDGERYVETNK
jgi:hypothetical protein